MYERHLDTLLAAWNEGDLDGLEGTVAANAVRRSPPALNSDADDLTELKDVITRFREAYPDAHVHIDEFIEQGDRTFTRWTFTGTNTGPGDFAPTGKSVRVEGASFGRYQDGKMVEELVYFDALGMMSQLGLIDLPEG